MMPACTPSCVNIVACDVRTVPALWATTTLEEAAGKSSVPESPQFGLRWKIFELDGCEGAGKVCLVFPPKSEGAQASN